MHPFFQTENRPLTLEHTRYYEISLTGCKALCQNDNQSTLNIILFKDDRKLRSHTVKHFTNLVEFESAWKGMISVSLEAIVERIEAIKNIGCLYYELCSTTPPCGACRQFDNCTELANDLESAYLECALSVLDQCSHIPRFALFLPKTDYKQLLFAMPDRPIVMKACRLEDNIYNLMTLYSRTQISFSEMRDIEIRNIHKQADRKTLSWCTRETWDLFDIVQGIASIKKRARKSKKNKKKFAPYKRAGQQNWKEYLNDF